MKHYPIKLAAVLLLAAFACVGCDDDADDAAGPMVMRPVSPTPRERPATRPTVDASAAATQPGDDATLAAAEQPRLDPTPQPAFITVTDESGESVTHEFPPARLYLKADPAKAGDPDDAPYVRALVYSDDPPEALREDWANNSFYFEMDLAVPFDTSEAIAAKLAAGQPIAASDLDYAEWSFIAPTGEKLDGPSGIFLNAGGRDGPAGGGGGLQLQPGEVLVTFDPLGDGLVEITLVGDFNAFDADGFATTATRIIRVRAVLTAEPVKR